MNAGDLLFQSSIMAGIADPRSGQLAPEDSLYAWNKLADLIDLLKLNRLLMFRRQRAGPFTVTAGQGDITASSPIIIGPGAGTNWNTPRPVWIDGAGVIYTAGGTPRPELPMRVLTVAEWRDLSVKGITSTLSRALIYDQTFNAVGNGNIYLYPVPSESFQVVLYVPIAIEEFPLDAQNNPDFTTGIALPFGYRSMLISNLAVILCLGLKQAPQDVKDFAAKTLGDCMSSNVVQTMDPLACELAVLGKDQNGPVFNWIDGGFK